MSYKLGRNYSLTITGSNFEDPLVVGLPFTMEFDITRNTLTSANVCQIRLYNLSPENRSFLRKSVTSGYGYPFIYLNLMAGYGSNLSTIFSGNVSQGWSVREGVNFISQLECYDGGFAYVTGQIPPSLSNVPAGTPYSVVIANLISSLPNVTLGAVGPSYSLTLTPKALTLSGNTIDVLKDLTGGGFFIDNGIGYALSNDEYNVVIPPVTINAGTGLLGTPLLENNIVRFDMIFEPSLNVGASIILNSSTLDPDVLANYNGAYKITAVKHRGMISQTVCGEAITTGEFFALGSQTGVSSGA
jgi:hypothetical protein